MLYRFGFLYNIVLKHLVAFLNRYQLKKQNRQRHNLNQPEWHNGVQNCEISQ